MNQIDWKRKLTSRKLWIALAGFVSGLLIYLGHTEQEASQVAALIMSGASVIAYCVGEGLQTEVDDAREKELLQLAQSEIGYLEKSKEAFSLYGSDCLYQKTKFAGADNYTKYSYELRNAGYGHPNGQPWCMTFVCWLLYTIFGAEEADRLLCGMLSCASTMDTKKAMISKGRQVPLNKAQGGDIVFRSRSGGGHVGLVVGRTADGRIITIEGNTSKTDATAWNGGAVAQHTGGSWEWCCRPDYKDDEGFRWIQSDGTWYYQDGQGRNWHGWAKIRETGGQNLHWYWFDWHGAAATGAQFIDGKWYFFWPDKDQNECMLCVTDESGAMVPWNVPE